MEDSPVEDEPTPTISERSESESSFQTISDEDNEEDDYSLEDSFDGSVARCHDDDFI